MEEERVKISYVRSPRLGAGDFKETCVSSFPEDIVTVELFIRVNRRIPCYIDIESVSIIYRYHSVADVSHFPVIVWGIRRIDCKTKQLETFKP